MTEKILYWTSVAGAFVALLLLIGNIILISGNRQMQEEVGRRQAIIGNAGNLSNLNQSLAQALAEVAVKGKDSQIRDLLAAQGITVREQPVKSDEPSAASKKK
jgi:hypothetical protein